MEPVKKKSDASGQDADFATANAVASTEDAQTTKRNADAITVYARRANDNVTASTADAQATKDIRGLDLTGKLHRTIDIGIALLIGWYRIRVAEPQPEKNPNTHYIREKEDIDRRIANANTGAPASNQLAVILSVAGFVRGMDQPRICDFGGGHGEDCLRFRRYIPDAIYTVVEIPEIVESAKRVDALKGITFSTSVPSTCDVFYSGGVVMNAHVPLFEAIKTLRPPRMIITSVEITDSPTYWSMVVYRKTGRRCPYITFNRQEFLDRVTGLGYTLTNTWYQGQNTSGVFLNGQKNPDAYGFAFIRNDVSEH